MAGSTPHTVPPPRRIAKFGPKLKPLADRFWAKVEKRGTDDCWIWAGHTNGNAGYGMISDRDTGRKELAHRVSWMLARGAYPTRLLRHSCDTPLCVNPAHLNEGTHKENMLDAALAGRTSNQNRLLLSVEAVTDISERWADGESQASIAKRHGVHQTYVSRIVRGRILKHVGDNPLPAGKRQPRVPKPRKRVSEKVDEHDVRNIRYLAEDGFSHQEIATRYSLSKGRVTQIVARRAWAHVV